MLAPWKKSYDKPKQHIKKERHYLADKGLYNQSYGFSIWELDHKERWVPKIWCFWTVVLEKTLESPLDCKDIKPVNTKGNKSWIFIGRTDAEAEAEAPILWPPDAQHRLIGKDPDAEKDWRQKEKGTIKDEMVGRHYWLSEHEFEPAPGDGWRTERPGVLQSMGLQTVRHDWATELNWTYGTGCHDLRFLNVEF